MDSTRTPPGGSIEAINGGHLDWYDFRENVLRPFRISCVSSPEANNFPKSFLARLQIAQKDIEKYDVQRQAWRDDVSAGRGLNSFAVFPPNLVPPQAEASLTLRCMLPRMSREGLPLRLPQAKNSMYELPTARPIFLFGFDMDLFPKAQQVYLTGALAASGVFVDYHKGEVFPLKTLCCPFLAFEKSAANDKKQIETARNACAITGAQCLRGQQQLFHKAFGPQASSQPLITFTCAINNEYAVINYHTIGADGDYNMAALCKFDLDDDEHFNTFQAWIDAIDNWATMCLLPPVQAAISQVIHSHPTPPPSPSPTANSMLSIDTKSSDGLAVISELRRTCPSRAWRCDSMTVDTPINSSMAICGTPLPAREIRSLSLPTPSSTSCCSLNTDETEERKKSCFKSPRISSGALSPIRTDIPYPSANRPRTLAQYRLMMSPGGRTPCSPLAESTTPISPCRPSTLSPCTPGPDMPTSPRNPILVLQKRLDVAVTEIQELRSHVDELQEQLHNQTAQFEQKIKSITEKQEDSEKSIRRYVESLKLSCQYALPQQTDEMAEPDVKTPTNFQSLLIQPYGPSQPVDHSDWDSPSLPERMPGHYVLDQTDNPDDPMGQWSHLDTQDLIVRCLAEVLRDGNTGLQSILLASLGIIICTHGPPASLGSLLVNIVLSAMSQGEIMTVAIAYLGVVGFVFCAAIELSRRLDEVDEDDSGGGEGRVVEIVDGGGGYRDCVDLASECGCCIDSDSGCDCGSSVDIGTDVGRDGGDDCWEVHVSNG